MAFITDSHQTPREPEHSGTMHHHSVTHSLSIHRTATYRYGSLRSVTQRRADRAA
ncbi:hypothetical protein [Micromonospora humi]|uniref:hypothetical protein n=1 Tax=Micromonospora humi TaxID=745366 RepID=UPI0015860E14|nr:hypothetical protein [Micromonospora humi]